jgi:putative transposase
MRRTARIDAPGALHHIIARGIGRRKIFDDDADRDAFLERLGIVLSEGGASCYARALIHITFLPAAADRPGANVGNVPLSRRPGAGMVSNSG